MITYYEILEVSRTASKEVITKAYKVLVRKYHPDLEQDETKKEEMKQKMVKINEAYEILSDEEKRKKYDEKISMLEESERLEEERKRSFQNKRKTQSENQNYNRNINKNININEVVDNSDSVINISENQKKIILQEQLLKAEEEIQIHKQNIVNQMYEDYYNTLRRMGYNVVFKRPLKERIVTYLVFAVVIIMLVLIYNIPFVRMSIFSKVYGTVFEIPIKIFDVILTLPFKMLKS